MFKNYKFKNELKEVLKKIKKREYPVVERISQIKCSLPYQSQVCKLGQHIGQRKLLLNEIQFLSSLGRKKKYFCIYAGSAPGNKTFFLSQMFPNITFILVDPNIFNLIVEGNRSHRDAPHNSIIHMSSGFDHKSNRFEGKNNKDMSFIRKRKYPIFIYEEYMTTDFAKILKGLPNTVFISDIRTNEENEAPSDTDIQWNNSMMFNWMSIMKPIKSMIKFRTLFGQKESRSSENINKSFCQSKKFGIDFEQNTKDNKIQLPKGELFIQPWAPKSSTELRLVIKKKDLKTLIFYDSPKIEQKLFYFNLIERVMIKHKNSNSSKELHFCHCNDCALENKILQDYGYNREQIYSFVKKVDKITKRKLKVVHKHLVFDTMSDDIVSAQKNKIC